MRIYWQLFYTFFRIGLFTIGGGYAMIPLIEKEVVGVRKWLSEKDFLDMLAMAQSSPGVIAINTAIFVGYKLKKTPGAIVTALGGALPSFIVIILIATWFVDFRNQPLVDKIFKGIRPAVVALIAAPLWKMAKSAGITKYTIFIPLIAVLLIWGLKISPVYVVATAIIGGIVYRTLKIK